MKKLIPFMMIALTGAAGLHAQETVTSVNAVGMVKVSISSGELSLVQIPFNLEQNVLIKDLLGLDLPVGTSVFTWDPVNQNFGGSETLRSNFFSGEKFWDPGTVNVNTGVGFFISIPPTNPVESFDIVLSGEVPSQEVLDVPLVQGLQFVGFPLPISVSINDPSLNLSPQIGDAINEWTNNGWQTYTRRSNFFTGAEFWDPDTFVFEPGKAYFYSSVSNRTWSETKDNYYQWP